MVSLYIARFIYTIVCIDPWCPAVYKTSTASIQSIGFTVTGIPTKSAWDFLGVNFWSRDFFGGLDFWLHSITARHLKSRVPPMGPWLSTFNVRCSAVLFRNAVYIHHQRNHYPATALVFENLSTLSLKASYRLLRMHHYKPQRGVAISFERSHCWKQFRINYAREAKGKIEHASFPAKNDNELLTPRKQWILMHFRSDIFWSTSC